MTATVLGLVLERRGDADISAIGGDHSCHLLPLLDRELIRTNPKVVIGYSDMTVLNLAIHARTGLVTFNGPHAMAVFGQFPQPHCYTVESFQRVLTQTEAPGTIAPATDWTEELQEWATQEGGGVYHAEAPSVKAVLHGTERPRRMVP